MAPNDPTEATDPIHDAVLDAYRPDELPDYNVYSAVVALSTDTVTAEVDA